MEPETEELTSACVKCVKSYFRLSVTAFFVSDIQHVLGIQNA